MGQKEFSRRAQRVLVTGATGAIGQPVCAHLRERGHFVRGLSRRPADNCDEVLLGDISDPAVVNDAVAGIDTVIHLAAYPNDADFADVLLPPNVLGLYHVCNAAREHEIQRLVLAGTLQQVGGYDWAERTVQAEDRNAPRNHYGLTKVWAEAMGEMYAHTYGLSVLAIRIGWLPRNSEEAASLQAWSLGPNVYLSHGDAARYFACCVESESPASGEFAALFATSRSPGHVCLDIDSARRIIGYEPQDCWPEGLPFALD